MAMKERPVVNTLRNGGKYWEHEYEKFYLKAYVPYTQIDGKVNNYTFRAPLLLIFEETRQSIEDAVRFADTYGFSKIAGDVDASVLFIYPTNEGGWENAPEDLYASIIAEVKMNPNYADGICEVVNMFTREHQGYFIRGAIFRADIYSFGKSADYVAKNLLKTIQGEYLWGPGEITPAMCSMQGLSVIPKPERGDIGILSIGNSAEINAGFAGCENLLVRDEQRYLEDFNSFVRKFKMWCGNMEIEPHLWGDMHMIEEAGSTVVKTSKDNWGEFKGTEKHKVGYFAYYNEGLFDKGSAPLVVGFHGMGDSSMFLTFVSGWWEVAHKYGFLFVSFENHQNVPSDEVMQVIEHLKGKYNVDEHRIYAVGFSMGCGKTWDLFQEFPDAFAGVAPASALFPVHGGPFAKDLGDRLNMTVPVPIFYSGGENSHLTELPCQGAGGLERIQYAVKVNKVKAEFNYTFEEKDKWEDPIWSVKGDRVEEIYDETRDSYLKIHYFDSEDGVCRTAFASITGQGHEYRHHTADHAYQFISQFTR